MTTHDERCRDCGTPTLTSDERDRCPACLIESGMEREEVLDLLRDEALNDREIDDLLARHGLAPLRMDERREPLPTFVPIMPRCFCGYPLTNDLRYCSAHGPYTTSEAWEQHVEQRRARAGDA